MSEKHPVWTRKRIGRNKVHWVAYDDRPGGEDCIVVDQGYASSLVEADTAARSALADAGMYQARRMSTGFAPSGQGKRPEVRRSARTAQSGQVHRREYLYTRRQRNQDDGTVICAHLILKKTAKKVYVTQSSCWWALLGTEEERWNPADRAIALDRAKLERDGSIYSLRSPLSNFFRSREMAMDDSEQHELVAFGVLGLHAPCTFEEIKAAYRRRAMEVHPDRGGSPIDFQAVEDAYRRLLSAAEDSAIYSG